VSADATRSVVVERDIAHPPEKIWRALTEPHLIEEWLMRNDFSPRLGHRFAVQAEWGAVACEVRELEPHRALSYSWDTKDLESLVTWTLTPIATGTRLRMEQTGFQPGQRSYYQGAVVGWKRFIAALEETLARLA
jgi:uncharacterized protein YndB with AHSA1/START domain